MDHLPDLAFRCRGAVPFGQQLKAALYLAAKLATSRCCEFGQRSPAADNGKNTPTVLVQRRLVPGDKSSSLVDQGPMLIVDLCPLGQSPFGRGYAETDEPQKDDVRPPYQSVTGNEVG
uniref:Uncharacterized protein n=1 Tax=Trichuris muris TaxID=70415 RepID=A0A5S6R401_TRIMR